MILLLVCLLGPLVCALTMMGLVWRRRARARAEKRRAYFQAFIDRAQFERESRQSFDGARFQEIRPRNAHR